MVAVDGKCTEKTEAVASYECSGEAADECYKQCEKGNLPSCTKRAQMGLNGVNGAQKEPLAAAKLLAVACKAGHARACAILGAVFLDPKLVDTPDPKGAFDLFQRACNGGDELGCYGVGGAYLFGRGVGKNQRAAITSLAKSCDGGWDAGCSDLGVLFLGGNGLQRDDLKAATLFKRACDGKNPTGCSNLGYMVETGTGVAKDVKLAAQLYEKACNSDDETCSSVAVLFQLGKGEPKNDNAVVTLHKKACAASSVISCAFLKSYVDPKVNLDLENAKNAMSVWQGTCTNGITRDCTQAAVIALAVGLKDQGLLLMKKACQLGDDWACANDKLVLKNQ
jgi:TPR repeat protein